MPEPTHGEFEQVSLGFAEFVSQILHETVDALLGAQDYQLDRQLALEAALALPDGEFQERYVGAQELAQADLDQLLALRREQLAQSLHNLRATRLMVDSGELKVKVELSNLFLGDPAPRAQPIKDAKLNARPVQEWVDRETGRKTVLFDKSALLSRAGPGNAGAHIRMIATPARRAASADLLSELTIRFKTV